MKKDNKIPDFSLQGGPLYWLGRRLGFVKGTNTFRLGLALGLFSWGILIFLVLIHGYFLQSFSLTYIGVHVRLIIAIPLFFLAETWVLPRMSEFIRNIVDSGLITETDLPHLSADIRRIEKLKDPWILEILLVLAAFIIPMFFKLPGMTGAQDSIDKIMGIGSLWTKYWYLYFCLPLIRYLTLRWAWYLILWWYFLWRVQKLKLNLIPTHPDRSAGLGYLEVVQMHFAPLILASSAIFATAFAENISSGVMKFQALYHLVPTIILIYAVIFICPLYIFSNKLWKTKVKGLNEYMVMAHHYVDAFDQKWLRGQNPAGEEQLGTGDIQSLADLNNSVNTINAMRIIPTSRKLIISFAVISIIPMLPLLLLKYPLLQIVGTLLNILSGQ
jgi:hypothetical protein